MGRDVLVYDNQAKPERMLLGTQFLIDQGLLVAGSLAFDWILFGESMKRFHAAKVATTSIATSPSAYYPPTCICMGDDVTQFQKLVMPIAQFFQSKGYKEIEAVWLVEAHPSWFSISRQAGFQRGLDDPKVQEVCKIKIVDTKPVLENDDTKQRLKPLCNSIRTSICSLCSRINTSERLPRSGARGGATFGSLLPTWTKARPPVYSTEDGLL